MGRKVKDAVVGVDFANQKPAVAAAIIWEQKKNYPAKIWFGFQSKIESQAAFHSDWFCAILQAIQETDPSRSKYHDNPLVPKFLRTPQLILVVAHRNLGKYYRNQFIYLKNQEVEGVIGQELDAIEQADFLSGQHGEADTRTTKARKIAHSRAKILNTLARSWEARMAEYHEV